MCHNGPWEVEVFEKEDSSWLIPSVSHIAEGKGTVGMKEN